MIAAILPWLNKNTFMALAIVGLVVFVFTAGANHERRKTENETARVNLPLAELKGKDEAEVAAEAEASKVSDAAISGAVKQSCPLTEETARLMASVR